MSLKRRRKHPSSDSSSSTSSSSLSFGFFDDAELLAAFGEPMGQAESPSCGVPEVMVSVHTLIHKICFMISEINLINLLSYS